MKKIFLLFFMLAISANAFAQTEVQVIPYKIKYPTDSLTIETGSEYAKLITLASAIKKEIIIYPHSRTDNILKKYSINSQGTITESDLIMIGDESSSDFLLLGTISRFKGNYVSDSILYDIRQRKIFSKNHSIGSDLITLAENETAGIFYNFQNRTMRIADNSVDAVMLIDMSYKISPEWETIKKGIREFSDSISENWGIDTNINIIPYSNKYSDKNAKIMLTSHPAVERALQSLQPMGDKSAAALEQALSFSINRVSWRRNSDKMMIIISNNDYPDNNIFEKYSIAVRSKKISVYTIPLGLLKGNLSDKLKDFSAANKGKQIPAAYRQRFFNEKGDPIDVFYQNGRLFDSLVYNESWKDGLFTESAAGQEKPKDFLNEIFFDGRKYNINPYNIAEKYSVFGNSKIINSAELENNIDTILMKIGESFEYDGGKPQYKRPLARAQISDGSISLWITIKEEKDLEYFSRREIETGFSPVGVIVKKNPNEPYGISFNPDKYITEYSDEFVPDSVRTDLTKIIRDSDRFTGKGLFRPPVWFIDVRVERIEKYEKENDIREE